MSTFIDKRNLVNGKKGRIKLSNGLNLDSLIRKVATPVVNNAFAEATEDINTLRNTVIVTDDYSALESDYRIFANSLTISTISLPSPVGITGKTFFVFASGSENVSVEAVTGTINGQTSITLINQYEYIEVCAVNGAYMIVNSNYTPS